MSHGSPSRVARADRFRCVCCVSLLLAMLSSGGRTASACDDPPRGDLILVQGAGGETQYETAFAEWCEAWRRVASDGSLVLHPVGPGTSEVTDREVLRETLARLAGEPPRPIWLVLIGHGTFFHDNAKFNLAGPDVSADELAQWLAPLDRPMAIVNCASCSAPFLERLSGPDRVIVTATRSGSEHNYARFGKYLSEAIHSEAADLDHDGSVSLLEVFLTASSQTQTFYQDEGRLATEHALLDDNGDRTGTSADFFRGIHVTAQPQGTAGVDGVKAHQWMVSRISDQPPLSPEKLVQRDELEAAINALRQRKTELDEDEYYKQLETHLIDLSRLYVEP